MFAFYHLASDIFCCFKLFGQLSHAFTSVFQLHYWKEKFANGESHDYTLIVIAVIQQIQGAKSECSGKHASSSCTSTQSSRQGNLFELNEVLENVSYVEGYTPTQADLDVMKTLTVADLQLSKYPHISRWHCHISSFSDAEKSAFPEVKSSFKFSNIKSKVRQANMDTYIFHFWVIFFTFEVGLNSLTSLIKMLITVFS